jgi:hypothetical protein
MTGIRSRRMHACALFPNLDPARTGQGRGPPPTGVPGPRLPRIPCRRPVRGRPAALFCPLRRTLSVADRFGRSRIAMKTKRS